MKTNFPGEGTIERKREKISCTLFNRKQIEEKISVREFTKVLKANFKILRLLRQKVVLKANVFKG